MISTSSKIALRLKYQIVPSFILLISVTSVTLVSIETLKVSALLNLMSDYLTVPSTPHFQLVLNVWKDFGLLRLETAFQSEKFPSVKFIQTYKARADA